MTGDFKADWRFTVSRTFIEPTKIFRQPVEFGLLIIGEFSTANGKINELFFNSFPERCLI